MNLSGWCSNRHVALSFCLGLRASCLKKSQTIPKFVLLDHQTSAHSTLKTYPEIEKLKQHFRDHSIKIERLTPNEKLGMFWVRFTVNNSSRDLYIDDEYSDFSEDRKVMALFLVLTALADYKESSDFLVWAKENFLDTSETKWLEYYKAMADTYNEIEAILGDLNPQISYYDYSMQTELGQALRKLDE